LRVYSVFPAIQDPNIALCLVALGLLSIFVECLRPGFVLPGVFGAVTLVIGTCGLLAHHVTSAGVVLLVAAAALPVVLAKSRFWSAAAVFAFTLGVAGVSRLVPGVNLVLATVITAVLIGTSSPLLRLAYLAHANKRQK
jgi:membrane-bound serine protease (ClpP class)